MKFSAGIQAGHFLAVAQQHWLDNIHFQEALTLDMFKMRINLKIGRISTVEKLETEWTLFFREELTWKQLMFAISAELQLMKVSYISG